jgi:serine/threonine protein kinase
MKEKRQRSYSSLDCPAADPIPFNCLQLRAGRRGKVKCYMPNHQTFEILNNVLYQDCPDSTSECAYYPPSYRSPIKTITGHVEICNELIRLPRESHVHVMGIENSNRGKDVFQWTDNKVAVKVHYCSSIDKLRKRRHAEDAIKETASMQLIGNKHEHITGCRDILFDGENLNVIMQCYDSGDFFELICNTQTMNALNIDASFGLAEDEARFWFRQVVLGLQELHFECGICHK